MESAIILEFLTIFILATLQQHMEANLTRNYWKMSTDEMGLSMLELLKVARAVAY